MPTIGAKSENQESGINQESQNQAIHRGYLYFKSHTIHIKDT